MRIPTVLGGLLLLAACGTPTSTPTPSPTNAASGCAAAAEAFALPGLRITEAESIAADSVRPPGVTAGPLLAAHCRIQGRMNERTGIDGKPYHIGFELRLPTQWNGRLLYQGGGGNDGVIRPAVGPQAAPGYALNRGFAVVTTDAGHQGPDASFGFDPIARTDNAYAAHDRVAVTAKELLIPGMAHCQGGAATDSWDGLGALVDWVEKGQAPQRIVASGTAVFPGRTRPLCPYPQYAHYNGSGNPEDAANFSCRQP